MKKVYISPFTLLMIVFSFYSQVMNEFLIAFVVAIVHEFSHLIVAAFLRYEVKKFKLMPYGACLELENDFKCQKDELLISSAGPFSNLIMLFFCVITKHLFNVNVLFFAYANIYMLILNLIPVVPLDGGRIFKALTEEFYIPKLNLGVLASVVSTLFILLTGVILIIKTNGNFSLFLVGIFLTNNINVHNKKSMYIYDSINLKRDFYIPGVIVLNKDMVVSKCLKHLSKNQFMIVFIIDKSKNISGILTNTQIFNFASMGFYDIKLEEIQNKIGDKNG